MDLHATTVGAVVLHQQRFALTLLYTHSQHSPLQYNIVQYSTLYYTTLHNITLHYVSTHARGWLAKTAVHALRAAMSGRRCAGLRLLGLGRVTPLRKECHPIQFLSSALHHDYPLRTPNGNPNLLYSRRVLQTSSCNSPDSLSSNFTAPSLLESYRRRRRSFPIMSSTQTRNHGGHHGGHHHHDNSYLTSQNKNDAGVRITRLGLYSNLGMAIAKGVGGYVFNSKAMIADAIHSVTDLASDILTLATISWSIKPPSDSFPTGFGKIESLGSLGVSSMLFFGGLWMGYGSLLTIYGHFFLDAAAAAELLEHAHSHSHGHDHGSTDLIPSMHAAWLAAGTVAIKEWLYHASKLNNAPGARDVCQSIRAS